MPSPTKPRFPNKSSSIERLTLLTTLIVSLILASAIFLNTADRCQLACYQDGALKISDFVYHLLLTKGLWTRGLSPYLLEDQRTTLSLFAGTNIQHSMPVGALPSAFLLWLPFSYLDLRIANAAWIGLSLFVFSSSIALVLCDLAKAGGRRCLSAVPIVLVLLFSQTMLSALVLGQTSIIATGALLHLYRLLNRGHGSQTALTQLLIFPLMLKPPYFLLAVVLLLLFRRWRELGYSLIILSSILLAASFRHGANLLPEFIDSLRIYTVDPVLEAYKAAIAIDTMVTVRAGFGLSAATSTQIYISLLAATILVGCILFLRKPAKLLTLRHRITIVATALILLFPPYLGAYELPLLIVPVYCWLLSSPRQDGLLPANTAVITAALAVVLNHPQFMSQLQSTAAACLALSLLFYLGYLSMERTAKPLASL